MKQRVGKKNTRFEQPYKSAQQALDPKRFGLAYDRERRRLCVQINGHHLFHDGSYNLTPDPQCTVSFGDALDMLKRILKSAAMQQAGKMRLIPVSKYADEKGLNASDVNQFCTTQLAYGYGVRLVAKGDGTEFYLPDTLDPRLIILASEELLHIVDEIRYDLLAHPASTASSVANRIKRNSRHVQKELVRMKADSMVAYDSPSQRWTLINVYHED